MEIARNNITSAYVDSLKAVVNEKYIFVLVVKIEKPLIGLSGTVVDKELGLLDLNLDKHVHNRFKEFIFKDGKSGRWWIKNRVKEMLKGSYYHAITKNKQLDFVIDALRKIKAGNYTWCSNYLLCITFDPQEKYLSHIHLSRKPIPPCLTLLDFKPERNRLHLIASWRAQYFDTKAYGNLLSLGILLREICVKTEYDAGCLISIARKAILRSRSDSRRLLRELR